MSGGPRRLLRDHDFGRLWLGQSISDLGSTVSGIVIPFVAVVYLKATAFEVGALAACQWLPWLLIGLPAGVWVDRSRKRPVLIWCDVVRLLLIGSVPVSAAMNALTIGQLFAVAFATGLATVLFQVAYQSYLPILLERDDLAAGNALMQGTQAVSNVVGPGLGGLLVQLVRAPYALVVDAASYLVSVLALLGITAREPEPDRSETRSLRREIAEGARYVRADPLLRVLTISPAVANFFFIGYEAIAVLFLVRTVHLKPGTVGVLLAFVGLGAVAGAAMARSVARRIGTSRAIWVGTGVTAPFALLIPLTTKGFGVTWFVVGNVVVFMGVLVYNVTIGAFRQAYVPARLLGRVVASMRFVLFGTMPLGALLGGALASALGTRTAIWLLVIGEVAPAFILFVSPLRTMRDLPTEPRAVPEPVPAAS
jgi:MFS family permease